MSEGFDPFDPDEWGDKTGCSAFETALEMRGRGALAPDAVAVLEVHLGVCDACRDHAARLGRVDASLAAAAAVPDARRLRGKMDDALKETRRRAPLMLVLAVFMMAVAIEVMFWIGGTPLLSLKALLLIFGMTLATSYLGLYIRARRLRRFLAETDVIGAYRQFLQGNIKALRMVPWTMILNVVIIAPNAQKAFQRYAVGVGRQGGYLILDLVSIVLIFVGVVSVWRQRRRMKAELKELH